MTTPLPGDVALGRLTETVFSSLPGHTTHRARPVAFDDAVLAAVDALRAIVSATSRLGEAPVPLIEQARKALEVFDGR